MAASKNKQQDAQLARLKDYFDIFNSPQGQRVLNDMMRVHYVMNSTFDPNPAVMALREGERNAVLRIMTILKVDIPKLRERIQNDEAIRNDENIV